jgi:hypothetical protein
VVCKLSLPHRIYHNCSMPLRHAPKPERERKKMEISSMNGNVFLQTSKLH